MRLRYTVFVLIACVGLPLRAAAQPDEGKVSDADLAMLKEARDYMAQCAEDPAKPYCDMLRLVYPTEYKALVDARRTSLSGPAPAPVATAPTPPAPVEANVMTPANGAGAGPLGQQVPRDEHPMISLEATTDTKTATIGLSLNLADMIGATDSITVSAQTPLGQGQGFQNVATQDGLAKATSIGATWNFIWNADEVGYEKQVNQYQAVLAKQEIKVACRDAAAEVLKDETRLSPAERTSLTDELTGTCYPEYVESFFDALSKPQKAKLVARLADADRQLAVPLPDVWMVSLNSKVGYEEHTFYTGAPPNKNTLDKTPFQAGVALTRVFSSGDLSLTGAFNYQIAYDDGGSPNAQMQVECANGATVVLKCINGYLGAPLRVDKALFSFDLRYIQEFLKIPVGFDPTVTYDANSGVYGFQLPVYLFANKAKTLQGGIRYDWKSDTHQSVVGIFVGSAFCVLPFASACPSGDTTKPN